MKKPIARCVVLAVFVTCATTPIACLWSIDSTTEGGRTTGNTGTTKGSGSGGSTPTGGGSETGGGPTGGAGGATSGGGATGGTGGSGATGGTGGATGGSGGTAGKGGTGGSGGTGGTGGSGGSSGTGGTGGTGGNTTVTCGTSTCNPYEIPGIASFPACCPTGETNGCGLESMGLCLTTTPGTPDPACPGIVIMGLPSQTCCTVQKTCGFNFGPPFGCNDIVTMQGGTPVPCGGGGGSGGAGGAGGGGAGGTGGGTDASVPPRVDSGVPPADSGVPPFDVSIPPFDVGGGRG